MVELDAGLDGHDYANGRWSISTRDTTATPTAINVQAALFTQLFPPFKSMVIDGVAVRWVRAAAGGAVFETQVWNGVPGEQTGGIIHYLGSYTTVKLKDGIAFYPLNIPLKLAEGHPFIRLEGTAVALDVVSISAWGRYTEYPDAVESIPDTDRGLLESIYDLLTGKE